VRTASRMGQISVDKVTHQPLSNGRVKLRF
jgi:hypothetical protein